MPSRLRELSPLGFDVVIDCTGVPDVVEHSSSTCGKRGSCSSSGQPDRGANPVSPSTSTRRIRGLGTFALRNTFHDRDGAVRSGAVEVERCSRTGVPDRGCSGALDLARSGEALKVQIARDGQPRGRSARPRDIRLETARAWPR